MNEINNSFLLICPQNLIIWEKSGQHTINNQGLYAL